MAAAQAASVLQSFPFRAAVLALCVLLLPLLPPAQQQQAPEAATAGGGAGQAFVAKAWELLHLLIVGIAVSYGLFSRKNSAADDGRGHDVAAEKEEARAADARYVSRMFRDSLGPFDDEDDVDMLPGTPGGREDEGGGGGGKARSSWSAMHRPDEPTVVVTNGGGGRSGHASGTQAPLSLPVRMLKPQPASAGEPRRGAHDSGRDETVLPSPIPWRSRSGRFDAAQPASPRSPKRLSPASSSARETLVKASEEYYTKRRSPHRSRSSTISSPPPAPPPPPPPFLVHGYHPVAERRTAKSFKEELQDHSMRGRGRDDEYYSPNTNSFDVSAYSTTTNNNSSPAKARSSLDTGSSSSSASIGKSMRTFRAREAPVFQGQSQEAPEEDGVEGRDALDVHEAEEPYGYRAYQSIPRFQYERSVSDPILGGVAVSSDETESSDDDDDDGGGGGGAYSTRESTPEVDENEVDKKAEEFIARFREQIRRQRIESIKRSAGPRGVKHGK